MEGKSKGRKKREAKDNSKLTGEGGRDKGENEKKKKQAKKLGRNNQGKKREHNYGIT